MSAHQALREELTVRLRAVAGEHVGQQIRPETISSLVAESQRVVDTFFQEHGELRTGLLARDLERDPGASAAVRALAARVPQGWELVVLGYEVESAMLRMPERSVVLNFREIDPHFAPPVAEA